MHCYYSSLLMVIVIDFCKVSLVNSTFDLHS